MLGDTVIEMPSDLRPTAAFELDSPSQPVDPRKGITKLTVDIPSSYNPHARTQQHPKSRWRTPEFMFYYVVFAFALPLMAWITFRLSSGEYSLIWFLEGLIDARGEDEEARVVRGWLQERLAAYADLLMSLLKDEEQALRVCLVILYSLNNI